MNTQDKHDVEKDDVNSKTINAAVASHEQDKYKETYDEQQQRLEKEQLHQNVHLSSLPLPIYTIVTDQNAAICYVHDGFTQFTGYEKTEFLGRKCSFLQGEDTDPEDVTDLRIAIKAKRPISTMILNYTKDNVPFWNILTIKPLYNKDTCKLTHFLGEIMSIPVPVALRNRKLKFCLDDGLALIKTLGSLPPSVRAPSKIVLDEEENDIYIGSSNPNASETTKKDESLKKRRNDGQDKDVKSAHSQTLTTIDFSSKKTYVPAMTSAQVLYKHVNYAERLSGSLESFVSLGSSTIRRASSSASLASLISKNVDQELGEKVNECCEDENEAMIDNQGYEDVKDAENEINEEDDGIVKPHKINRSQTAAPAQHYSVATENDSKSSSSSKDELTMKLHSSALKPSSFDFIAETLLPTNRGRFRVRAYRDRQTGAEPLAMIVGEIEKRSDVLCRVHDQCVTSEVFGSLRCDCREQLEYALDTIQMHEGIVLYLPQEGRGIGLANKIAAYAVQQQGYDTVDANRYLGLPDDAREYTAVRDILNDLQIVSIRLMTNNPLKIRQLELLGVRISERVPCIVQPNSEYSKNYVMAKVDRMGHMIDSLGKKKKDDNEKETL